MPKAENIRIAKNTVIIYIRMAVTILVGLITSRLVLQALGATDVGIYSVVGSTVAMVTFITSSMTATTVRFMNFELGKADGNPNRIFNICHVVHIGGALLLLLLLETIGIWYINTYLNVPPGREGDAMFVFQVSTLVACLAVANVPFQGLFTVHEKFSVTAAVDIANALVKLGLVLLLLFYRGNGLRMYAVMMSMTTLISFIVYHALGSRRWRETVRWNPVREKGAYREILVFNNYTLLSSAAIAGRSQGSNMLINLFFGTTVNAAYFYAGTVQNYVNQFIANFDTAAAPQITQNISAGNEKRSIELAAKVGRICILLFLLLLAPLWCELDFLLKLWLGEGIPEGTAVLCRCTLLVAAVSSTSAGLTQLISGYGHIKWYKIELSVLFLLCLPAGYFLFKNGAPAHSIILCFVGADILNRIIQLLLLRYQEGLKVWSFIRETYLRPMIVAIILVAYMLAYSKLGPASVGGKVIGIALTLLVAASVIFVTGLKREERKSVLSALSNTLCTTRRTS